ncbi:MAG: siderophore-interacting protein [Acidimicrobiales bacterium]
MYAEVKNVERLTPSMMRVVLSGGDLDQFEASAATDSYINARFLPVDSPVSVPFEPEDLEGVDPDHRPRPRRFTVRRWEPESQTLTIDFVAHGDEGYAGTWAKRAKPGDRLQFTGPNGSFQPSDTVDWHLFVGDESAIPAIAATLESLPAGSAAMVFAVVDSPDHELELQSAADITLTWLYRDSSTDPETLLPQAVAAATFLEGTFDVFVHGEAGEVRAVRKHLVADRGVDPDTKSISAYWRRTYTDEAWREVKREWIAEQAADV